MGYTNGDSAAQNAKTAVLPDEKGVVKGLIQASFIILCNAFAQSVVWILTWTVDSWHKKNHKWTLSIASFLTIVSFILMTAGNIYITSDKMQHTISTATVQAATASIVDTDGHPYKLNITTNASQG